MVKEILNGNSNTVEAQSQSAKTPEIKKTSEDFLKASQEKDVDSMIKSIGSCEAGSISKDMVTEMINSSSGQKALLDNFSKLKDIKPQELAEMIIDSGKNTKVLLDNEVGLFKSKKELSLLMRDISAKEKSADTKSGDVEQIKRNLSSDETYQGLIKKEPQLRSKIIEGDNFVMDLDKNKLLTKCFDIPNFFTPDKLAFFCAPVEGNRLARGWEDALIQIAEKNNYDSAHMGALISVAGDKSFGSELADVLKKNGKEDLLVSFEKKFKVKEFNTGLESKASAA